MEMNLKFHSKRKFISLCTLLNSAVNNFDNVAFSAGVMVENQWGKMWWWPIMKHCHDICLERVNLQIIPVDQVSGQYLK